MKNEVLGYKSSYEILQQHWENNLPRKQQQLRNSSTTRPPTPDVREEDRILCRTRQNPLGNENVTS